MTSKDSIKTIKIISLGCAKNLVDSDTVGYLLKKEGYRLITNENEKADIGIVNTCGFIEEAKQESIDTILELAEEKKNGELDSIVAMGCMSQRYQDDLPNLLPEVDFFVGTGDFLRIPELIKQKESGLLNSKQQSLKNPDQFDWVPHEQTTTPFYSQYIKISEGCSHECSFCTIPLMRGGLKSRPLDSILTEMQNSLHRGTKEFNLIAQDLNEYGRDLDPRTSLTQLFEETAKLKGNFWLRPLYMYPLQFPDKLIRLLKDHPHFCNYVDIPLQHIDDEILKSMKRGSSAKYIYRLLENLKKEIPHITLRTTFIVGYPGETDQHFQNLLQFIKEMEFDNVGAFTYSHEEDTPSFDLPNQIDDKIKQERKNELMKVQQEISRKKKQKLIGKNFRVLFEGKTQNQDDPNYTIATARHAGQAPDIDGEVLIQFKKDDPTPQIGDFIDVKIIDALDYDLIAQPDSFMV